MGLANELGVDVPKTYCFDSIAQVTESIINKLTFPCYLKAAISIAGVGIYRCENRSELKKNLKKFGLPSWCAINFNTQHRHLKKIDLSGIEYDKKTHQGIILVNWGTVLRGKLIVLLAGSRASQKKLELELIARL